MFSRSSISPALPKVMLKEVAEDYLVSQRSEQLSSPGHGRARELYGGNVMPCFMKSPHFVTGTAPWNEHTGRSSISIQERSQGRRDVAEIPRCLSNVPTLVPKLNL
jgi:hypothetical protein